MKDVSHLFYSAEPSRKISGLRPLVEVDGQWSLVCGEGWGGGDGRRRLLFSRIVGGFTLFSTEHNTDTIWLLLESPRPGNDLHMIDIQHSQYLSSRVK